MKKIIVLSFVIFFIGCGYKPIAHHSKEALGKKVHIEVKIDTRDSQNSVVLKDKLAASVMDRLHLEIVDKDESYSIINVRIRDVNFESLAENKTGFSTFYRCIVNVDFQYQNIKTQKARKFHKRGFYNFSLNNNSIITDSIRMDAINNAVLNALDDFILQVGIDTIS